jgi:acetyl-CoA acetyltransferase
MASRNILKERPVYAVGIGLHRYQHASEVSYVTIGLTAVRAALADADIGWRDIETAYVGNALIGMAAGSTMLRYLGPSDVSVAQVENASASGSTAFRQAAVDVASGLADVSIAIGVDKPVGGLGRGGPMHAGVRSVADGLVVPFSHFAMLTERYMAETGATLEQIAKVAVKNHANGARNPFAQRQKVRTLEEVLAPPQISGALTRLQCTPVGEGAAATIVASEEGIRRMGIDRSRAIRVTASASRLQEFTPGNADAELTRKTTVEALEAADIGPTDLDVIELHDAFSIEELLYAEAMGLCGAGEAAERLERGEYDIGGKHAISPSGGLLAMGHPIGPTGVGQVCEIVRQLRDEAGDRQHPGARIGLAHMVGIGAVCVVHVLQRD